MNQMKQMFLLASVLILGFVTAHLAFAAVQKTSDKGSSSQSPTTSAPSQSSGPTVGEGPSILNRVIDSPQDCVPPSPNCPDKKNGDDDFNLPCGRPAYVQPVGNICPQGYYCRTTLIAELGARERWDGTCTVNETELDEKFRDCAKVTELCQKKTSEDKALYQKLCA